MKKKGLFDNPRFMKNFVRSFYAILAEKRLFQESAFPETAFRPCFWALALYTFRIFVYPLSVVSRY